MENVLALIHEGKIEEAESELNRHEAAGSPSGDVQCMQGLLLEAKGEAEGAIASFEAAVASDSGNAQAVFHLARMMDLYTEDDRAIELYEQLASRTPAHVHALLNLAAVYEDRGRYKEANVCVSRVLVEHPNHPRARMFQKDIESSTHMLYDEAAEQSREKRDALLETPITDFELSVRSRNCLKKMNINVLGDLLRISEAELLSYKNFGETSLNEIKAMLKQRSLRIGQLKEEMQQTSRPMPLRQALPPGSPDVLGKYLSEIEFSGRSRKCLQRLNVMTLGDLTMKSEAELLATKNFGQTSLLEIKQKLAEFGLSLRK